MEKGSSCRYKFESNHICLLYSFNPIQDGDNVIMTGVCKGEGFNVGFGSVEGVVLPAVNLG